MKKSPNALILGILFLPLTTHFEWPGRVSPIHSINLISRAWAQSSENQSTKRTASVPDNYTIGQGDMLEVFVWRNEELSRQAVVRPDGKISLPLVRELQAEGLTVVLLENEIVRRLKQYVHNPTLTVMVLEINSYKITVLGEVANPGVYPLTTRKTVLEAISEAGGFTQWANQRKIMILRDERGKKQKFVINFNYKKITSGKDPSQDILLKRGDRIIVP